jgi:malic enzyme
MYLCCQICLIHSNCPIDSRHRLDVFDLTIFNDVDHIYAGAVVLSGFFNAAKLSSQASGIPLSDHRILFFGAGSAGIGVAKQLLSFFTMLGVSEEDAKKRIYVGCFVHVSLRYSMHSTRPWTPKV